MISTVPIELQSQILSYLPRKDLLIVTRVSRQLHAVAIRILYVKVELRSWAQLESFFLPSSLLPLGSLAATTYSESRRMDWDMIKDLTIDLRSWKGSSDFGPVPPSLQEGDGLHLERLRLVYPYSLRSLVPLLRCLNPVEVGLSKRKWIQARDFGLMTVGRLSGWTRRLTFVRAWFDRFTFLPPPELQFISSSPFKGVTSASLILQQDAYMSTSEPGWESGKDATRFLLRLCPSLEHLRIVAGSEVTRRKLAKFTRRRGKGPGFFFVENGDVSGWGDE